MKNLNLRQLRKDSSLTQYGLAKLTRIDRTRISHAELGFVSLTADELARIRRVFITTSKKKLARLAELEAETRSEQPIP
jgi:transcriptional regulator with XRE-family HTH domain